MDTELKVKEKTMGYIKSTASAVLGLLLISQTVFGAAIDDKGFTVKDIDGNTVSLSDFKGKIVVLEWTNYDCPFVVAHYKPETMTTAKLARKFADSNVVWLTINSTHYATAESTKKWAEPLNLPKNQKVLMDADGKAGKLWDAKTTPHIFILNRKGEIAYQGALDNAPMGKVQGGQTLVNYADQALGELTADKPVSVAKTTPYGCSVKYPPQG
jgi:peroxiredoxin